MTATIFYRVKGMFSHVDVEETVYHVETLRDGKGINKIVNAMKFPYEIECRFDCENRDVYYVERSAEDIDNGIYTVRKRCVGFGNDWEEKKMDGKTVIKMLKGVAEKES